MITTSLKIRVIAPNREKEAKAAKPYSKYWEGYITLALVLNGGTPARVDFGEFTFAVNAFPNKRVVQAKKSNDLYAPQIGGFFGSKFVEGVAKKFFLEMLENAEQSPKYWVEKIVPLSDELIDEIINN